MMKILLRTMVGIGVAALVLGTPPAYAIFGIRAARKVLAARKAEKLVSTSSADKEDTQGVSSTDLSKGTGYAGDT